MEPKLHVWIETGERRPPRPGEYYIPQAVLGAEPLEVFMAMAPDATTPRTILKPLPGFLEGAVERVKDLLTHARYGNTAEFEKALNGAAAAIAGPAEEEPEEWIMRAASESRGCRCLESDRGWVLCEECRKVARIIARHAGGKREGEPETLGEEGAPKP